MKRVISILTIVLTVLTLLIVGHSNVLAQTATKRCADYNIQGTISFTHLYGVSDKFKVGDVITASSLLRPNQVYGCFEVNTAGYFGYMRIYGEDKSVGTPGMKEGQVVQLKINGKPLRYRPSFTYINDWLVHEVTFR